MRTVVLLLLSLSAGCGLLLDPEPPPPTQAPMDDGGVSADATSVNEGGPVDAPAADVAPPPPPVGCGGPTVLTDDFDDANRAIDWGQWWRWGASSLSEELGMLVVKRGADIGAAGYRSTFAVDLRGDYVAVRLASVFEGLGGETSLRVLSVTGAEADITVRGGAIVASTRTSVAGTPDSFERGYVPTDRWVRIREFDGILYFETSDDGVGYGELWNHPAPATMEAVWMELSGASTADSTGEARFDDFNLDRTGRALASYCSTSTLSAPYEPPQVFWSLYDPAGGAPSCDANYPPSAVELTPIRSGICEYGTATAYDLTGQAVYAALSASSSLSAEGATFFVTAFDRAYRKVHVYLTATSLWLFTPTDRIETTLARTRPIVRLELREADGTVQAVAVDDLGGMGTSLALGYGAFDPTAVAFGVGVDTSEASAVDGVNLGILGFNTDL